MVAVATLVLSALMCRWHPGLPRRDVSIKRFFRFGGGLLGTQLLGYATKNVDSIAIGTMYGSTTLGFYNRAYQLLMTPLNQINAPLTNVALPVLAKVQDNPVIYGRYLAKAQLIGGYVTASALAVSAGVAEPLITVAFGEQWPAVAPIFALLAIGGIFRSVAQICYWVYLSHGLTGAQLRLYLFLRPAVIVITLAGLPWGAVGVAAASSIGFLVDWVVTLWHVHRVAGVDSMMLLRNSLRAILLFGAPAGLLAFAGSHLFVAPLASLTAGVVCALVGAAISASVFPAVRSDLTTMLDFVRRALGRPPPISERGARPKLCTHVQPSGQPRAQSRGIGEHHNAVGLPDHHQEPVAHLSDGTGNDVGSCFFGIGRYAPHLHRPVGGHPTTRRGRHTTPESVTAIHRHSRSPPSFAALATSTAVLEPVIGRLRLDTSAESLARDIEVTIPTDTVTMQFTVKAPTADGAAQIADAVAEQLADLTGRMIQIEQPDMLKLTVTRAPVPEFASAPRRGLNLLTGAAVGLMLAVIAAVSWDWQMTRRRTHADRWHPQLSS